MSTLDKVIKEYVDGITLQDLITQVNSQIDDYFN